MFIRSASGLRGIAKEDFSPTKGCIALRKSCLIDLLKKKNINEKIKISLK